MYYPSLEMLEKLDLKSYDLVPIKKEIYSDMITPIELMRKLKQYSKHVYMLESHEDKTKWGRYTFIGFDPKSEITCYNKMMKVDDKIFKVTHPKEYIRKVLNEHRSLKLEGFPTFTGGLVGYFSFDYFKYSEPSIIKNQKDNGFNDVDLMLFDKVICFDHFKQKLILIVNIGTNDLQKNYKKGIKELDELDYIIRKHVKTLVQPLKLLEDFKPVLSKKEYCQMVEKGIDYIKEGDIFQVVLSNRLYAKATGSLFDSYRVLRTTNPSPYMFYFASDNIEVAGASPETLIKLEGTKLTTFPIAGTRKRGKDDQEDQQLIDDLLKDEKELDEHNMLVDLGRNDLGKISKFNSVHVVSYMDILKFSKVIHIASIVSSEIKEEYDALDAVDALLPAGTLSGAPKIRACQIINQLDLQDEQNKRGIYGGAIGYLDFTGNMDLCIGIRLAYKRNNEISICSGAGIVYDSVPENEYQECLNKAGAVVEAIKMIMILLIDNYDSFAYNLYQLIGSIDEDIKVIRNDEMTVEEIEELQPSCIIISPGPGKPSEAGIIEEVVQKCYTKYPILGVCLGHQAIVEAFGGTVSYAQSVMHGKSSIIKVDTTKPIFKGIEEKTAVARYHSLAAKKENLPECLKIIGESDDGEIMAISHKNYPVYGLQFHPESILTKEGKKIVENFLKEIQND